MAGKIIYSAMAYFVTPISFWPGDGWQHTGTDNRHGIFDASGEWIDVSL